MAVFESVHRVPASMEQVFAIFSDSANLSRLTPRWMRFRLLERPPHLSRGARMRYRMAPLGLPVEWLAEITDWTPPRAFVDQQVEGPYKRWRHRHQLLTFDEHVEIRDRVEYQLPGGALGMLADRLGHRLFLRWIFHYRSQQLDKLLRAG